MTITDFMDKHSACRDGRAWAEKTCETMDDVWRLARPDWLLWVATRSCVLTDRELRLFSVWSARQVQHLMTDARSLASLDVAERHANGEATDKELVAAWAAARDAARAAAGAAAWAADRAADRAAARAAAWAAAGAAQAEWLRANTTPRWEVTA
jgi:hypothetical protein